MTRHYRATAAQKAIGIAIATLSMALLAFVLHAEDIAAATGSKGTLQVDITSPADRSRLPWQAQGNYSVTVSYDGRSTRYGDMPSNQVLVTATYLPDIAKAPPAGGADPDSGLVAITQSNCTGCHDFAAKAVGPSFAAIGQRHAAASSVATLADHIRNGSGGSWGTTRMPPHPDLDQAEATEMAQWIVAHANDPGVRNHVGNEGSFRMEAPTAPGSRAGMMLTATYTGTLKPGDTRRPAGGRSRIIIEAVSAAP